LAGKIIVLDHRFDRIHSSSEYQHAVPLSSFDDYSESLKKIAEGQKGVLTSDPVLLFEPTSGSTSPSKHIPYTAGLKSEFEQGIGPWFVDLYHHYPSLIRGQAYWSVTPAAQPNGKTASGIPIGFEEDTAYLGSFHKIFARSVMAVPVLVRHITDMASFRYATVLFLLRSRSLTLISIWNPTFILLITNPLKQWWPKLTEDIARGTLSPPNVISEPLHKQLAELNQPDPIRAAEIRNIFESMSDPAHIHVHLWPNLRLISCWTDILRLLSLN